MSHNETPHWTSWLLHLAGVFLEGTYSILTGTPQVEAAEAALAEAQAKLAELEQKNASANVVQKFLGKYSQRRRAAEEKVSTWSRKLQEALRYRHRQESLPFVRFLSHLVGVQQRFKQLAAPPPAASHIPVASNQPQAQQQQPHRSSWQDDIPEVPGPSAPSIDEMCQVPGSASSPQASGSHQNIRQPRQAPHSHNSADSGHLRSQPAAEASRSTESCCICLDGEPTCGLIPCGHRVCRGCGPSLVTGPCPLCRTQVTATLILY